jgi:preprotein translocase subunit YajC
MAPLILILLFVVAWVILILPKQRELKRHNALVASLSVGDDVMTGSGIYGTIVSIEGDVVILQIAAGVEIKFARRAVASKVVVPETESGPVDGDSPGTLSEPNEGETDQ